MSERQTDTGTNLDGLLADLTAHDLPSARAERVALRARTELRRRRPSRRWRHAARWRWLEPALAAGLGVLLLGEAVVRGVAWTLHGGSAGVLLPW